MKVSIFSILLLISGTYGFSKELSRLVKRQQAAIEIQNLKIAELADAIRMLKEKGCVGQP